MVSGSIVNLLVACLNFFAYPVYLSFLGYEKYGLWLVLFTVVDFCQVANIGVDVAIMKIVSENKNENSEILTSYVSASMLILFVSGFLVISTIVGFRSQIISLFDLTETNSQIMYSLLPYMAVLSVYMYILKAINAVLAGLGRYDLANYVLTGGRFLGILLSICSLILGFELVGLLVSNFIYLIVANIVFRILIKKESNVRFLSFVSIQKKHLNYLIRYGGNLFMGSLVNLLYYPVNKIIISRFLGISLLPVFDIAYRVNIIAVSFIDRAFLALLPEISFLARYSNQSTRIFQLDRKTMKVSVIFCSLFFFFIFGFSEMFLKLWLRDEYVNEISLAVKIMAFFGISLILARSSRYILLGYGLSYSVLLGNSIQTAANLIIISLIILLFNGELSIAIICSSNVFSTLLSSLYFFIHKRVIIKRMEENYAGVSINA